MRLLPLLRCHPALPTSSFVEESTSSSLKILTDPLVCFALAVFSSLAADQESLDDLSLTLTKIATAASLGPFSSGMAIRFVNSDLQANAGSFLSLSSCFCCLDVPTKTRLTSEPSPFMCSPFFFAVSTPAQALQFLKGASKKFAGSNPVRSRSLSLRVLSSCLADNLSNHPSLLSFLSSQPHSRRRSSVL